MDDPNSAYLACVYLTVLLLIDAFAFPPIACTEDSNAASAMGEAHGHTPPATKPKQNSAAPYRCGPGLRQ